MEVIMNEFQELKNSIDELSKKIDFMNKNIMKIEKQIPSYVPMHNMDARTFKEGESYDLNIFDDESIKMNMEENLRIGYNLINNLNDFETKSILYCGGPGSGKTTLCNHLVYISTMQGYSTRKYSSMFEIIYKAMNSKDRDKYIYNEYQFLFDCDFLIIDNLGEEYTTNYTIKMFNRIISERYDKGLKTIITTQSNLTDLITALGEDLFAKLIDYFICAKLESENLYIRNFKSLMQG